MKVLSLFDGISCARVALERAGIPVEMYYASEIDKYAMQISMKNYPDIVQVGSVVGLDTAQFKDIDLLIGGSPCQDLSIAKKDRKGLDGSRSGLFWEYVRILKEVKPKYFILENVNSMPKEAKQIITEALGVEPIMIDAALVSAQRRKRLFWTNIPNVTQPEDLGILLKDILEDGEGIASGKGGEGLVFVGGIGGRDWAKDGKKLSRNYPQGKRIYSANGKATSLSAQGVGSIGGATGLYDTSSVYQYRRSYWRETVGGKVPTLTANMGTGGNNVPYVPVALRNRGSGKKPEYNGTGKANALTTVQTDSMVDMPPIRKLTPLECERLQSLPDGYTEGGHTILQKEDVFGKMESWKQLVSSKGVKGRKKQISVPVSCTISDTLEMALSTCPTKLLDNVIFAIDHKSPEECVISITKTGKGTEMLDIQIKLASPTEIDQIGMDTLRSAAKDIVSHIEMSWRPLLGEDSQEMTSFITSTLTKLIIDQKISTSAQSLDTNLYMITLKKLLATSSSVELLCLKMGRIGLVSDTQRYKALGNAFNVEVVAHILKHIIPNPL